MTAPTARDEELQALRRPFAIGAGCVVLAIVLLGVVIALFGSNADRPAGIAERWLVAVGDTTRDGVEDDARNRIEELSGEGRDMSSEIEALVGLSPTATEEGEAAFDSVQVGRPVDGFDLGDSEVLAASVTPADGDPVRLYVVLEREHDRWVFGGLMLTDRGTVEACGDADECEGFPIERPERAPIGWFVGALLLGGLITLGCVAAVRAATPTSD